MHGIVVKAVGGFCFVRASSRVFRCTMRGKIKLGKSPVLVGDGVEFALTGDDEGVVGRILSRRNMLARPPVANVDQAVIVMAIKQPDPAALLLDRFLIQNQLVEITPIICFNKFDLVAGAEPELVAHYEAIGYPVLKVSAKTGMGINELRSLLQERVNVLAGPSGAGKSSLLNAMQPGLALQTGEISRKLKRGKHTTRQVELLPLDQGGLVADTPGFTSISLPPDLHREELAGYYAEFTSYNGRCRFNGCLHAQEPDCAVKEAVNAGQVSSLRYRNYLYLLQEVTAAGRKN